MDELVLEWLDGLAGCGCVFVELLPGEKRTRREWAHYEAMHGRNAGSCVTKAQHWLASGSGLGFFPRGPLWVLDIDEASWVEQVLSELSSARFFAPWLRTPSGGAHFYFAFPDGFQKEGLKNHLCHPRDADGTTLPLDFKFGPRTLLVAPGTLRKGRRYEPQCPWFSPPALDPAIFLPGGEFWMPPKHPFLVDERPFKRRIARACCYLKSPATPVSINGHGGQKVLATVTAYLVAFLQLDPAMAFHLMTHGPNPWNSRCSTFEGTPYPWSQEELWRACLDAVDSVPEAGLKLYQRNQLRAIRDECSSAFIAFLRQSIRGDLRTCTWVEDLQHLFEEWTGATLSATAFGLSLRRGGITRRRFSGARIWGVPGVDTARLVSLLQRGAPPA